MQAYVSVVRNGEGYAEIVALRQDKIVVPLLDPEFGSLDSLAVIDLYKGPGPAGFS